jgi:hypothetical protein
MQYICLVSGRYWINGIYHNFCLIVNYDPANVDHPFYKDELSRRLRCDFKDIVVEKSTTYKLTH